MTARALGLPAAAVVLVAAVLGIQLARGGGRFEPLRSADPCAARPVETRATGIDGLSERLVLLGIDGAACRLGQTREAFTLALAQADRPSTEQVEALRAGLLVAVRRMKTDGSLPRASALVDEALDEVDLPGLVKTAMRALPDGVIDSAFKTDDVLTRAIDDLDLRALLADLDDQAALERRVQEAVTRAAQESLEARLRDLI